VAKVASFLSDLRRSEFIAEFNGVSAPEGKVVESQEDLVPRAVWEFPMTLSLAPHDPKKAAGAAAPGAGAKPPTPADPSGKPAK
jgi:hypothetical protein